MRNEIENFNSLVDRAMNTPGRAHMRPVITKELLHYDILFALDKDGLLDKLTFQGGTSLRLCYGAPRLSEDLDFVGGKDFVTAMLIAMKNCLEKYIGSRYGLDITVKAPNEMSSIPEYEEIKIDRWQIKVTTAPERKDLPKQKVKIEVGNVPAYSREPRPLLQNYDFLPDGYSDTLVLVETLDEIMADKCISLVNNQKYVRHRDIWDLHWLKRQGATLNANYIQSKIRDYKADNYLGKLDDRAAHLEDIIHGKAFRDEMSRFIPMDIQERTLQKEKFLVYLTNEIQQLLSKVRHLITVGNPNGV